MWLSKQTGLAGTDLPTDFPSRSEVVAAGYLAVEDIDGASVVELRREARLSTIAANAVLAAIAAL